MSIIFTLFPLKVLEMLDLDFLDFWLFTQLSILEYFSTWYFKPAIIPVCAYLKKSVVELGHLCSKIHILCNRVGPKIRNFFK